MASINEIPLSADNQQFSISIAGTGYKMAVSWRDPVWCLDLLSDDSTPLALSMPLITGTDLLAQYAYLDLGFALVVGTDIAGQENPTKTDLGITSHLYVVTE